MTGFHLFTIVLIVLAISLRFVDYSKERQGQDNGSPLILAVFVFWLAAAVATIVLLSSRSLMAALLMLPALGLLTVTVSDPWRLFKKRLVSLHMPRISYWAAKTSATLRKNQKSAACLAALLTISRSGSNAPRWLRSRVSSLPVTATGCASRAILADIDNQREQALAFMELVLLFDPRHYPQDTLRIAVDWLITERAALGQTKQALALAPLCDEGSVAAQTLGDLSMAGRAHDDDHGDDVMERWQGLLHDSALEQSTTDSSDNPALARRWSRFLASSDYQAVLEAHAIVAEATAHDIGDALKAILARNTPDQVGIDAASSGPCASLDHLVGQLPRAADSQTLTAALENFAQVIRHYSNVAWLGAESREAAYDTSCEPLCEFAVWLWNQKSAYPFSIAVFSLLENEAAAMVDEPTRTWAEQNGACESYCALLWPHYD